MSSKIHKTNAIRLLDVAKTEYGTAQYIPDEQNLDAGHVASELGVDAGIVFKTLVLRGDKNGIFVCVIPGNCEVDLKKAALLSGNKKAAMLPLKELLPTTGYIRGGCSPIGMKKQFPTFIHESVLLHERVYVSAGVRGLQIILSPGALIAASGATTGDLVV